VLALSGSVFRDDGADARHKDRPLENAERGTNSRRLNLVVNWRDELQRLAARDSQLPSR
jgi:hypothetical protein